MVDVCAVGYVTRESETFRGVYREFTAGPPYFFSMALRRLGSSVMIVTRLNMEDEHILKELRDLGIRITVIPGKHTTSFHTDYGRSLDERYLKVISVGEPFDYRDLNYCYTCRYLYIGPLTTRDFDLEFFKKAYHIAPIILDVQGFTRMVVGDKIEYVDWIWKFEGSRYVTIFKADAKEAKLLTGLSNPAMAARVISSWGPREVIVTSGEGVYVYVKDEGLFFAPFKVDVIKGRVGRGDTCTGAYVHARLRGWSYEYAVKFAAAATSLKLMYPGPLRNTEEEVRKFIKEKYRDVKTRIE